VLPGARLVCAYQVHSPDVVTVTTPWDEADRPKADALVTNRPGLLLGVLTADCAPVLFHDPHAGVIGAAHAGWRGAIDGVTDRTVEAMEALGASRAAIAAVVGPCIGQKSYEVDAGSSGASLKKQPKTNASSAPGARAMHGSIWQDTSPTGSMHSAWAWWACSTKIPMPRPTASSRSAAPPMPGNRAMAAKFR
jgi:YfiH family protein